MNLTSTATIVANTPGNFIIEVSIPEVVVMLVVDVYKIKKKYGKTGWSYPEKLYWCHGYSLGGEQAACLFCYQLKMLNILFLEIEIQGCQSFELLTMRSICLEYIPSRL